MAKWTNVSPTQPEPASLVPAQPATTSDPVTLYSAPPSELNFVTLQNNLETCLAIVDNEVMKNYLPVLQNCAVMPLEDAALLDVEQIQFFRISEMVYQKGEFSVSKLATAFSALANKPCTLVLLIRSNGRTSKFYLGVRSRDKRFSSGTMRQLLEQSLLGLFPGSHTQDYFQEDLQADLCDLDIGAVSSVSCIADYKQNPSNDGDNHFIQGLEKFVDSMQGKSFTAICIANSLGHGDLVSTRKEYENIYTLMSPFATMQYNFALNQSSSVSTSDTQSQAQTDSTGNSKSTSTTSTESNAHTHGSSTSHTSTDTLGMNRSTGFGQTHTVGTTDGRSESTSTTVGIGIHVGKYRGVSAGVDAGGINTGVNAGINTGVSASVSRGRTHGTSHTDSLSDSLSKNLTFGLHSSRSSGDTEGQNKSATKTTATSMAAQQSESESHSVSTSYAQTKALTDAFGSSQGITLPVQNKSLLHTLNRLEKQLKRLDECESLGMWDFAAYFLGESAAESESAASMYRSLVSGNQTGLETAAINTWTDAGQVHEIERYLTNFLHPFFQYDKYADTGHAIDRQILVDATALSSTSELALQLGLPRKSIKGLPVIEHASFAQEVLVNPPCPQEKDSIALGNVNRFGEETDTKVTLDLQSLSMHTFVTGSTGSGKSNTIYQILSECLKHKVHFLVIEPAKGEYKNVFAGKGDVSIYGTNPLQSALLRINPFKFPAQIHVCEHMDRLVEIFNACWPMYAAMPAVLKNAVERSYIDCGWDLTTSRNRYHAAFYPTFADIARNIRTIIDESEYDADNKGAYKGSLLTRLQSLTNGINGIIFSCDDLSDEELFDKNVIVDLSRVGSAETKSLIMGMLVLKLQEYRMASSSCTNAKLKHITVLEEAHNLLKRTSLEHSSESATLAGKSVEMLANAIAEMRTYGEGFIIADQAPGLLDLSVIRNTNTKIILRLPDYADRELVGKAAALSNDQITELAKLPRGVAAVYQNEWIQPVLCKVDQYVWSPTTNSCIPNQNDLGAGLSVEQSLLDCLMNKELFQKCSKAEARSMQQTVLSSRLDATVKRDYMEYIVSNQDGSFQALQCLLYDFLDAKSAIQIAAQCNDIEGWAHTVANYLTPSIKEYSTRQINLVLLLLLSEQARRDSSYKDLIDRFTEVYQRKGGVF